MAVKTKKKTNTTDSLQLPEETLAGLLLGQQTPKGSIDDNEPTLRSEGIKVATVRL